MLLTFTVSALLSVITPNFLVASNLKSIAMGMTYDLIVALGMTYVLILGGLDLSVGSNIALTGIVAIVISEAAFAVIFRLLEVCSPVGMKFFKE